MSFFILIYLNIGVFYAFTCFTKDNDFSKQINPSGTIMTIDFMLRVNLWLPILLYNLYKQHQNK